MPCFHYARRVPIRVRVVANPSVTGPVVLRRALHRVLRHKVRRRQRIQQQAPGSQQGRIEKITPRDAPIHTQRLIACRTL